MKLRAGRALLLAASLVAALAFGCRERPMKEQVKARFGVFFGGDVQEREEIPLVLDRSRLALGLRVEWTEPPTTPVRVRWEIARPLAAADAGSGEVAQFGEAQARPGEASLDVPLSFRPSDRPGTFRVRVDVGDERVLERAFRVVPPGPIKEPTE